MLSCPQVNWELVAQRAGYSNANCAKTRFGQIKRQIGWKDNGSVAASTLIKGRAKKEVGSGTNISPSKVVKKQGGGGRKTKAQREAEAAAAEVKDEATGEDDAEVDEDAEDGVRVEQEFVDEDDLDPDAQALLNGFDSEVHEQLFKSYLTAKHEGELEYLDAGEEA